MSERERKRERNALFVAVVACGLAVAFCSIAHCPSKGLVTEHNVQLVTEHVYGSFYQPVPRVEHRVYAVLHVYMRKHMVYLCSTWPTCSRRRRAYKLTV